MEKTILEQFKKCPLCEKENKEVATSVVAQTQQRTLLHIVCPHCQGAFLVVISENHFGVMSIGTVTDLTITEAITLLDMPPITADTVLDVHTTLKKDNIDVRNLMQ